MHILGGRGWEREEAGDRETSAHLREGRNVHSLWASKTRQTLF